MVNAVEVKKELDEFVKRGYLKKTRDGYIDSDKVKWFLKKGKTRKQISKILEKKEEKNGKSK